MTVLYRIHEKLMRVNGTVIPKGCVSDLGMLSENVRALLLAREAISVVQAPPLDVFPGWKVRAERLAHAGIGTEDFVVMDEEEIVKRVLDVDGVQWREALVREWRSEVRARLGIGEPIERP